MKNVVLLSVFMWFHLPVNGQASAHRAKLQVDYSIDTVKAEDYLIRENSKEDLENKLHLGPNRCDEVLPVFTGDLNAFLAKNIKLPDSVLDCHGRVVVGFTIHKDGSLSNLKILRNSAVCGQLGTEVLRVFSIMANWKPGLKGGKPFDMEMILPVTIEYE